MRRLLAVALAVAPFPDDPPNDPLYDASPLPNATNEQWDLASPAGGFDRGISVDRAWPLTTGAGVTVAEIDVGVRYDHPDLAGRWAENPGETGARTASTTTATATSTTGAGGTSTPATTTPRRTRATRTARTWRAYWARPPTTGSGSLASRRARASCRCAAWTTSSTTARAWPRRSCTRTTAAPPRSA